jgi:hypothetical protein
MLILLVGLSVGELAVLLMVVVGVVMDVVGLFEIFISTSAICKVIHMPGRG